MVYNINTGFSSIRMSAFHKVGVVVVLALSSAYVYMALRGPQGFSAVQQKWEEVRRLQLANAALKAEVAQRQERIRRLEESPAEQELEIRKRLKLLKPNETTFIVPPDAEDKSK